MIENFKESPEEFKDYDSELLLKIINKTSVEIKTSDDKDIPARLERITKV